MIVFKSCVGKLLETIHVIAICVGKYVLIEAILVFKIGVDSFVEAALLSKFGSVIVFETNYGFEFRVGSFFDYWSLLPDTRRL